jgi:phage terminase large subunit-like protein
MSYRRLERFANTVGYELEPFQRKIARACYGDEHETLILLGRGEAKTTLASLIAVEHLVSHPSPAIYLASTTRDEARTIFESAKRFAEHPAVADRLVMRHLEMRAPRRGHLRVLASDARRAYSLSPTLVLLDELHAFPDDSLYVTLRSSLHKVPGARMIVFSAASTDPSTPLGALRTRALAQPNVRRRGGLTEAWGGTVRMIEWSLPDDGDPDDARAVKRAACPASWVTVEAIQEQREALPDLAFRRLIANQWVGRDSAVFPPGAWQACAGTPTFEPGEPVWVGVDLSGGAGRSDTAVVWVNESLHVGVEVWSGDHDATAEVSAFVAELADRYTIRELVLDFWRASGLASEFEQRGVRVVSYPQTDQRIIPASQRLWDAVVERRLVHPGDARLDAHVHAAISRTSRRGWRIDRPSKGPGHQIDGVMALLMALDRAEHIEPPVQLLGWL